MITKLIHFAEQTSFAQGLEEREIEYQAKHTGSVSSESRSATTKQQYNRRKIPLYTRPVRVLNNVPATAEERQLEAQFKKLLIDTSEESGEDNRDESSEDEERVPLETKDHESTMKITRVREK